jgi:serine/threonine protein phosphatase PrpC
MMSRQVSHIETDSRQVSFNGERICGDVFLSERIKEENRTIVVLADGMGHGVKANMLATLTATMALRFAREHKETGKIAELIMKTLPVCSERKMSYSTFTIVDIHHDQEVHILEFDNPGTIILRGASELKPQWNCILLPETVKSRKEVLSCRFKPKKEDRIILCSDGVIQSGLGTSRYPFGWGREKLLNLVQDLLNREPDISATRLSERIVNAAIQNDAFHAKDDTSCAAIYFREPRKTLICTGPPFDEKKDAELADRVYRFKGKIILCGATTAEIVSRELGREIESSLEFSDSELPPVSYLEGVDLVTEGILTLGKVSRILEKFSKETRLGFGPADQIIKILLQSDKIEFVVGTRINTAHQDPSLPVELEIRRTIVKKIAGLLEKKFMKEVSYSYI